MTRLLNESGRELAIEQVVQFFFNEQWMALRAYCGERKIRILGDVAIFVSYDSADVWTHPEIFELDEQRKPIRVSGVPPDYFSKTGQLWGNPLYKWSLLEEHGFDWWVARIRRALTLYDDVRLDHFRGFEAYWSVAATETTAMNGQWVKAPGHSLFQRLKEIFGELPFIAEDLGLITPEVDELREYFGMPGMRILQFGFRGSRRPFVPSASFCAEHRGVHRNARQQHDAGLVARRCDGCGEGQHADLSGAGGARRADCVVDDSRGGWDRWRPTCIFPLQDILHLGSEARMNTPAAAEGNWTWRYAPDALHPDFAAQDGGA